MKKLILCLLQLPFDVQNMFVINARCIIIACSRIGM